MHPWQSSSPGRDPEGRSRRWGFGTQPGSSFFASNHRRIWLFAAAFAFGIGGTGLRSDTTIPVSSADLTIIDAEPKDNATAAETAGDINNDGFGDLILGSENSCAGGYHATGRAYLIYGGPGLPSTIDLSALGGLGITILPGSKPGRLGHAISAAGDFNADGIDDFMLSADEASTLGRNKNGVVYVIFGGRPLPDPLDVSALGSLGVILHGKASYDRTGSSLSRAGDFNRDGYGDILIGARDADPDGKSSAGRCYIVFGGPSLPAEIDLASLGSRGVTVNGVDGHDNLGSGVGFLGDFNGDAIDDVIVGAEHACPAPGRPEAGRVSIIFGTAAPPLVIEQASLGSAGVNIIGAREDDHAGHAVSCAGDFNRDGFQDALIGAHESDAGGRHEAGKAYVIFGKAAPVNIDLLSLGSQGVEMRGIAAEENAGHSVACVGDFDPDGFPDVLIGAPRGDDDGWNDAGQAYLVSGQASPPAVIELSSIGPGGIVFTGTSAGDRAGEHVGSAGDMNGDGGDDLVISAKNANPLYRSSAGIHYVFFGKSSPLPGNLVCTYNLVEVRLTWTDPVAYDAIRIVRNGATLAALPGGSTSFSDPSPLIGVVTYQVIGVLGGKDSLPAVCELSIAVQPPFACACLVDDGAATISWVHRQAVDGTRLFRDGVQIAELPEAVRAYTDSMAAPGTHVYRIVDFVGGSDSTPVECAVIVPAAPSDLICTADGSDVTLSWKNSLTGGEPYTAVKIFRDGLLIATLSVGGMESFQDHGVPPGDHAYRVQGLIGGASSQAAACSVKVVGAPQNLTGSSVAGMVHLSWVLPEVGDEVLVFRDGSQVASLPGDATSFDEGPLAPGSYDYQVRVRSGSSLGKPADTAVEVVAPVVNLQGAADGNRVALTWVLGDVYDALEVFRDGVLIARLPGAALGLIDTVPGPGTYHYTVAGARGNGRSAEAGDTEVVPLPPINTAAILAGGHLSVTWMNGEAYGAVEVIVNGAAQPPLPGDAQSFETDLGPVGAATVEIRGVIDGNRSDPARTSAAAVDAPRDLICRADGLAIRLNWALGGTYEAVRIDRNGANLIELPGNAVSYDDTIPGPGDYTYQVRGVIGGLETLPAECHLGALPAPDNLQCTTDGSSVVLAWSAAAAHRAVAITRNGGPYASIPAGIDTFTDPAPLIGLNRYAVRLASGGDLGAAAECTVEVLSGAGGLTCTATGHQVVLAWTNPGAFDLIRIFRNGLEVGPPEGLPGTTTTFTDPLVSPGLYTYEVQGFKLNGAASAPQRCTVEVLIPPVRLVCRSFDGTIELNWINPRSYDAFQIFRDGSQIDQLAGTAMHYVDPDQPQPPGTYNYEVRGVVAGSASDSAACTVIVPLAVNALSCHQEGDAIILTWENGVGYDAINIHRNGALISTLSGNAARFEDRGLVPDVYSYEVRGGIAGGFSFAARCTVDMIDGPAELNCNYDGVAVKLVWSNRDVYDEIRIYRNGVLLTIPALPGSATSYEDVSPPPGTFTYEVEGKKGAEVSLKAKCEVVVIAAVFSLLCHADGDTAALAWQNGTAYDAIEVHRQGPADAGFSLIASLPGSAAQYTDAPLAAPGIYQYRVIGKAAGFSAAAASCQAVRVAAPAAFDCNAENVGINFADVRLTWTNNGVYDQLLLRRNGALIQTLPGDATQFVDAGLGSGSYLYTLTAVAAGNASDAASCQVQVTLVPPPVLPPSAFECRIIAGTARLSWQNNEAYEQVLVYRQGPGEGARSLIATLPGNAVSHDDGGLTSPGDYHYEVEGKKGDLTSPPAVCTAHLPRVPGSLKCLVENLTTTAGDVRLAWTNSETYDALVVKRDSAVIASLPGTAASFLDAGLAMGTYSYTLTAVSGGSQIESGDCQATIDTLLPDLTDLACQIQNAVAKLAWKNHAAYDRIEISRQRPGEAAPALIATLLANEESYTDNVTGGAGIYRYIVVGHQGLKATRPAECTARKPAEPTLASCAVTRTGADGADVTLKWTDGEAYDSIIIIRDGSVIAALVGTASIFVDIFLPEGEYRYVVVGVIGGNTSASLACTVKISLPTFVRGNANCDRRLDISDGVFIANYLFLGAAEPCCFDAADANDDGGLDISDTIYLILYQLKGGAAPPPPFPARGIDPTQDPLGCADYHGL